MKRLLPLSGRLGLSRRSSSTTKPSKSGKGATPPGADDVIPNFIGDTARGLIRHMELLDRRMQPDWVQPPVYDNEEDTPAYFAQQAPEDLIVKCDVLEAGKMKWPLIPEVDVRTLSGQDWNCPQRQQLNQQYCRKYGIMPDLFPQLDFNVNLNARYSDMYWHSAFFGNYMAPSEVKTAPAIHISPGEATEEGTRFTLLLFTPDYPFRTCPEDGHLLHWMICNVPMGSDQDFDTVVDYMPPLPTEYAGHFRYVFALFKQQGGHIDLPERAKEGHYPLAYRRNFFLHSKRPYETPQDANIMKVQQQLQAKPVTVTFFHTCYDWEVSEYYQSHSLQEPMYTPEPLLQKALMYRKYAPLKGFKDFRKQPEWDKVWPDGAST
mmetsp:Transcript_20148/g.36012  ORF Transcript_20148/g.36012 Transcript_20148/m.36012 type:complete len:377 (-) Transcript_20148:891-2021(-)